MAALFDEAVDTLASAWNHPTVFGFRRILYVVSPNETSFATVEDVPDYVVDAMPFFTTLIVLEQIILWLQNKPVLRFNDAYSSVAAGMFSLLPLLLQRSIEVTGYMYVYEHYRLAELPWQSGWTWFFVFMGVDFGYYWVHRMGHELNFMWAAHQAHHSSDDYNLSTALRQSILQKYNSWIFYLPMALVAPPSIFVVHSYFNLLYQFWIHTQVIDSLGPLEYILNTPKHHRVHHGRNRYCIDKNYGGTLIIWDRLFGTFAWEGEEVSYGLVHPLGSWDTIHVQFCWWKYLFSVAKERPGLKNKLLTFIYGPGWEPGKPRMGLTEDIPIIDPKEEFKNRYNKSPALWMSAYVTLHYLLTLVGHHLIMQNKQNMDEVFAYLCVGFMVWTLANGGFIMEKKWYAAPLEATRCALYVCAHVYICKSYNLVSDTKFQAMNLMHAASAGLWSIQCVKQLLSKSTKVE